MIDGPRRTALEEMHAARLAEEKLRRHRDLSRMQQKPKRMHIGVDPADPADRSPWVLWYGTVAHDLLPKFTKRQPWHRRLWRYLRALWNNFRMWLSWTFQK